MMSYCSKYLQSTVEVSVMDTSGDIMHGGMHRLYISCTILLHLYVYNWIICRYWFMWTIGIYGQLASGQGGLLLSCLALGSKPKL